MTMRKNRIDSLAGRHGAGAARQHARDKCSGRTRPGRIVAPLPPSLNGHIIHRDTAPSAPPPATARSARPREPPNRPLDPRRQNPRAATGSDRRQAQSIDIKARRSTGCSPPATSRSATNFARSSPASSSSAASTARPTARRSKRIYAARDYAPLWIQTAASTRAPRP